MQCLETLRPGLAVDEILNEERCSSPDNGLVDSWGSDKIISYVQA
jgi:hypothetical protein